MIRGLGHVEARNITRAEAVGAELTAAFADPAKRVDAAQ